jgi:hypothetical protein
MHLLAILGRVIGRQDLSLRRAEAEQFASTDPYDHKFDILGDSRNTSLEQYANEVGNASLIKCRVRGYITQHKQSCHGNLLTVNDHHKGGKVSVSLVLVEEKVLQILGKDFTPTSSTCSHWQVSFWIWTGSG